MKLDTFLAVFFPTTSEPIHLRAFPPKGAQGFAEKIATTRAELNIDRSLQARLLGLNKTHGLYFAVNSGGDYDTKIIRFNASFAEIDDKPIDEQHTVLDAAPLPPSIRVETRKSVHAYWSLAGACNVDQWREVQLRLIAFFHSDPKIKNPSRVMRLPFFDHHSVADGGELLRKRIIVAAFDPERRFYVEEMLAAFPAVRLAVNPQSQQQWADEILVNSFDIREHLHLIEGYRVHGEWGHGRCPAHRGRGTTSFFVNISTGAYGCHGGCTPAEIRLALGLPKRRQGVVVLPGGQFTAPTRPPRTVELNLAIQRPESVELGLELEVK